MDCERLLLMLRRQGYRGVTYRHLSDVFGISIDEAEKCAKKVGVDLGYGILFPGEF